MLIIWSFKKGIRGNIVLIFLLIILIEADIYLVGGENRRMDHQFIKHTWRRERERGGTFFFNKKRFDSHEKGEEQKSRRKEKKGKKMCFTKKIAVPHFFFIFPHTTFSFSSPQKKNDTSPSSLHSSLPLHKQQHLTSTFFTTTTHYSNNHLPPYTPYPSSF